jgi:hypothetical protein
LLLALPVTQFEQDNGGKRHTDLNFSPGWGGPLGGFGATRLPSGPNKTEQFTLARRASD